MLQQISPFIPQRNMNQYNCWASEILNLICSAQSELQIKLYIGEILDRHPSWVEALLFDYPHLNQYIELID